MNIKTLGKISRWMNSTDLQEVTWKKGKDKLSIKFSEEEASSHNLSTASRLVPVNSPSVGIFRFSSRGQSFSPKEGMPVQKGQPMGIVEVGKSFKKVESSQEGFIKIICVEEGKTVEYGQTLFFLEPK